MIAEFTVNGKVVSGNVDTEAFFRNIVERKAYASEIKAVLGDDEVILVPDYEEVNTDLSRGKAFYEAHCTLNVGEKRSITELSLGDVVGLKLDEETEGKCDIEFRLVLEIDSAVSFYRGDNEFIAALLGKKTLGKLTCVGADGNFGNLPLDPEEIEGERGDAEVFTDGQKLCITAQKFGDSEELVIENDGIPVIRVALKECFTKERQSYGICNNRGAFYAGNDVKSVVSLSSAGQIYTDYLAIPLVSEVRRAFEIKKCVGATVYGEPNRGFAAVKQDNRVFLYRKGEPFPVLVKSFECDGEVALCSDGTAIALCSDGVKIYFADGREACPDIPSGESVVIVAEAEKYHFAIKSGRYLLRYEADKGTGTCTLISAVMGENIGLFRAQNEAIGYRDGDIVAIVTTETYREFDYPYAGNPDDFGFVCDCANYSVSGKCGNYKEKTEFDLDCDFVGCDGLACAEEKLYSLGGTLVPLAEGITSAATLGNCIIAAEKECIAVYYAAFKGAFVFCDDIASKSYVFTYISTDRSVSEKAITLELTFEEEERNEA